MATKKKVKHWDNLVLNMKDLIDNVIKAKKVSLFFKDQVDEIAHGAPNYYLIIKHPMYLNKMLDKLKDKEYKTPNEVYADFKLIGTNCREYNTDVKNLVRIKSFEFDEYVDKLWKQNAEALLAYGVDINTAVLDYSKVDPKFLNEIKMTKEQKALLQSQGAHGKSNVSNNNIPFVSPNLPPTMNVIQPVSQPFPQNPPQNARRNLTQPAPQSYPYQQSSQTVKLPKPTQITIPAQHPPQLNPSIQSSQPSSYQQQPSAYQQPTYQPQYRPSYQPKTAQKQQPSYSDSFDRTGGMQEAKGSFKIDLSQLRNSYNDNYTPPVDPYSSQTLPKDPYGYNAQKGYDNEQKSMSSQNMSISSRNNAPYGSESISKPAPNEDRLFATLAQELGSDEAAKTSMWTPDEFTSGYNTGTNIQTADTGTQQNLVTSQTQNFMDEGDMAFPNMDDLLPHGFLDSFTLPNEPIKQTETSTGQNFYESAKPVQSQTSFNAENENKQIMQETPAPYDPFNIGGEKEGYKEYPIANKEIVTEQPQPLIQSSPFEVSIKSDIPTVETSEKMQGIEEKPKVKAPPSMGRDIWEKPSIEESKPYKEPTQMEIIPATQRPSQQSDKGFAQEKQEDIKDLVDSSMKKAADDESKFDIDIQKKSDPVQKTTSVKPPQIKAFQSEEPKKESLERKVEKPFLQEKSKSDKGIASSTSPLSNINKSPERKEREKSIGETSSNKSKMEIESEKPLIKLRPMGGVLEKPSSQGTSILKKPTETVKPKPFEPTNIEKNHEDTLSGLIEDILSGHKNTDQEVSRDSFGQLPERSRGIETEESSSKMIEKADENKTPKGTSNKIIFASKSAEKDRDKEDKQRKSIQPDDLKRKQGEKGKKDEDGKEEQYYKSPPPKDEASSKIRFDLPAIRKDFDTYKRLKIPKFIKKFQKHVKRLGRYFRDLEIKDEALVKLKEEVEHLNLTDKSLNYSRVLLYLFNVLVFCKYHYAMNEHLLKRLRKMVNIVKKAYFYIKETIKLQHMKFTEEETSTFDKTAREFRSSIVALVKQYKQNKENPPPNIISVPSFESKEYTGEMPSKITIIPPSVGMEPKIITKHFVTHAPKKEGTSMKVKILAPPKKAPKVETLQPKEETEEDIIKKEMAHYLSDLKAEFEAKTFFENVDKKLINSWKALEDDIKAQMTTKKEKQMEEEKAQESAKESAMEIENDNIFPTTSTFSSFTLQDKRTRNIHHVPRRSGSSSNRLSVFGVDEEKDQQYQQKPVWRPNPSLFQRERDTSMNIYHVRFAPDLRNIEGSFIIPLGEKFFNSRLPIETKISCVLFPNKRDENLLQLLEQKGIKYQANLIGTSNTFLNKLVLLSLTLQQNKNRIYEGPRMDNLEITIKNPLSIEAFDKMEDLAEEKIKNEIKLKDYNAILPLPYVKELIQTNNFIDKILKLIKDSHLKFNQKLALYYSHESKDDDKSENISWRVSLFMQIEDFSKLRIAVNNKRIV